MIDIASVTSSTAKSYDDKSLFSIKGVKFTSTNGIDERQLFENLNEQLNVLETSLEIQSEKITVVENASRSFRMLFDEKDEIILRVTWLKRLYEIKEAMDSKSVVTKEAAERLRTMIAPVQVCPLKNELIVKIDSLIDTLPPVQVAQQHFSPEEELMEKSLEEAGDAFINLGEAGRDYVISEILQQFGNKATVEEVKNRTNSVERDVNNLLSIKEPKGLIDRLDALSFISLFSPLPSDRKMRIAERLLEINNWNGLASLNRLISLLDKTITIEQRKKEEANNTIQTPDGKVAYTLDIENLKAKGIQFTL